LSISCFISYFLHFIVPIFIESLIKLQKAIANLPEKQQLVFKMKYFEDMKYENISEILDTSVGGLKANYHHAVKKIEEYLKNN
jgi:RNA polymerase sigma-70 factor (ECF subfamily)